MPFVKTYTMRDYVMQIARFFGITWLRATTFLDDAEVEILEIELGWVPGKKRGVDD